MGRKGEEREGRGRDGKGGHPPIFYCTPRSSFLVICLSCADLQLPIQHRKLWLLCALNGKSEVDRVDRNIVILTLHRERHGIAFRGSLTKQLAATTAHT